MKNLLKYVKHYWYLYIFGFAGMIICIMLDMIAPQITRKIIDDVIIGGEIKILMNLLLGLLGIGFGRAIIQYAKEFTFDCIGVAIGAKLRKDLFNHIQTLSMGYFDSHNTGELMARVKDDVDKIWSVLGFVGMLAVEAIVHTIMVLYFMFHISPALTLIPLAVMPLIAWCAIKMENGLGTGYDQISEETAKLNTVAQENLAGVRTVKAFAREPYEMEKFDKHNKEFYSLNMKQARILSNYQPSITFLGKVLLMSIIVVGGIMVINGKLTLGDLGAFSEYANNIIWPMEIIGWLSNDIASAMASNKKIKKIFSEEPEIRTPEAPIELERVEGNIRFEQVGLELGGREILKDISFDLRKGQTLGIMGMTGAGKTSMVNLLQRFYDVSDGAILLDGVDIRQIPLDQLRSSMEVVMQDVFLFSDTVNQNVRTGKKEDTNQDTVEWASDIAEAHGFITRLSGRYETMIGERGVGLSGGQKQRISIARAIAKKAPVLILDDSTSALDMETEHAIQEALEDIGETTKVIIGHRISAVRGADEIIILDHGKVVERGTHETLMAKKGQYYKTFCVQYGEEVAACQ